MAPRHNYMYFNLIPLPKKKPAALVLHVGTSNLPNGILFHIYDKLLNLVHIIKENNSNCLVVLSSSKIGLMMEKHLPLLRG